MTGGIIHVVSVSGGKDSLATLLIAIDRFGKHRVIAIFCDTGNEHELVYLYLDYLERILGITIYRLKADFSQEIASKRAFIARDVRNKRVYETVPVFEADGKTPVPKRDGRGNIIMRDIKKGGVVVRQEPVQKTVKVGNGRRIRWTNKAKRRALSVLHPTGNPFLDLCLWKGRFPSRKAQFCTEELKRNMAVMFQLSLIEKGHKVVSWQGIRRDESLNRSDAKKFEVVGGGVYIYRPIVEWSAMEVFSYCAEKGIDPNPLYKQGMARVGCMPCINVNKDEVREISARFPEHIDRISEWEKMVGQASKRQAASFIPAPNGGNAVMNKLAYAQNNDIYSIVKWSKTSRGGRQFSLLTTLDEPTACSSSYGLCE